MAKTQHINMLLFLLVLTACLEIQFAEGRQLKAMMEPKLSPVKKETGLKSQEKHATKVQQSLGDQKKNPCVTQQKNVLPPPTPIQSDELGSSARKHTSQPRTQGNSPGVGHSFPGKNPNMRRKVQDLRATAGETDASQYRTQGHSPGVGHSVGN